MKRKADTELVEHSSKKERHECKHIGQVVRLPRSECVLCAIVGWVTWRDDHRCPAPGLACIACDTILWDAPTMEMAMTDEWRPDHPFNAKKESINLRSSLSRRYLDDIHMSRRTPWGLSLVPFSSKTEKCLPSVLLEAEFVALIAALGQLPPFKGTDGVPLVMVVNLWHATCVLPSTTSIADMHTIEGRLQDLVDDKYNGGCGLLRACYDREESLVSANVIPRKDLRCRAIDGRSLLPAAVVQKIRERRVVILQECEKFLVRNVSRVVISFLMLGDQLFQ